MREGAEESHPVETSGHNGTLLIAKKEGAGEPTLRASWKRSCEWIDNLKRAESGISELAKDSYLMMNDFLRRLGFRPSSYRGVG